MLLPCRLEKGWVYPSVSVSGGAGLTLLTWGSPLSFIGKLVIFLHVIAAATNVARLGAIARPDQSAGSLLLSISLVTACVCKLSL